MLSSLSFPCPCPVVVVLKWIISCARMQWLSHEIAFLCKKPRCLPSTCNQTCPHDSQFSCNISATPHSCYMSRFQTQLKGARALLECKRNLDIDWSNTKAPCTGRGLRWQETLDGVGFKQMELREWGGHQRKPVYKPPRRCSLQIKMESIDSQLQAHCWFPI